MKATLLTIGDELLIGQIVDANAAWLARECNRCGIEVVRALTVGDEKAAIARAFGEAMIDSNIVIATGGLGPTPDDVTREAVAGMLGVAMRVDTTVLHRVRERFRERSWPLSPISERVALVPDGFEVLPNAAGTAPGLWRVHEQSGVQCILTLVPGVPREMKGIFRDHIAPRLRAMAGARVVAHRTLRTVGIGESRLQELMGDLSNYMDDTLRVASLPSAGQVRLRLSATGADQAVVCKRLDDLESHLRETIGPYIYGVDGETLEEVVGRALKRRGLTVAVAESCTGGLVLHRLTNTPGSSAYVAGGIVAYANAIKTRTLGVQHETLQAHGAVSREVAKQMALGVRERLDADYGLATTGIAGPKGGTASKPVGTVWVGCSGPLRTGARRFAFGKDRATNKTRSAIAALDMLRKRLLEA